MTRIVFSLALGRSRWLLIYLIAIHSLMALTLVSLLGIAYQSLIAVLLLLASLFYYCSKFQWLASDKAIIRIERNAEQQWFLVQKNGVRSPARKLVSSFVTPAVVILNFEAHPSVTLLADAVEADLLRQLRVYCRNPSSFYRE